MSCQELIAVAFGSINHLRPAEALLTARENDSDLSLAIAASLGWDGIDRQHGGCQVSCAARQQRQVR